MITESRDGRYKGEKANPFWHYYNTPLMRLSIVVLALCCLAAAVSAADLEVQKTVNKKSLFICSLPPFFIIIIIIIFMVMSNPFFSSSLQLVCP